MREEFELMWNGLDHENYEYDKSAMWFAWRMAWQEQQKKIDGALMELELLDYYRTRNSDNAIKILKGTGK